MYLCFKGVETWRLRTKTTESMRKLRLKSKNAKADNMWLSMSQWNRDVKEVMFCGNVVNRQSE